MACSISAPLFNRNEVISICLQLQQCKDGAENRTQHWCVSVWVCEYRNIEFQLCLECTGYAIYSYSKQTKSFNSAYGTADASPFWIFNSSKNSQSCRKRKKRPNNERHILEPELQHHLQRIQSEIIRLDIIIKLSTLCLMENLYVLNTGTGCSLNWYPQKKSIF